jgi:hypothetical protein
MIGRVRVDGVVGPVRTEKVAGRVVRSIVSGRPVWGFRPKLGMKLFITTSRIRCPRSKRFPVIIVPMVTVLGRLGSVPGLGGDR